MTYQDNDKPHPAPLPWWRGWRVVRRYSDSSDYWNAFLTLYVLVVIWVAVGLACLAAAMSYVGYGWNPELARGMHVLAIVVPVLAAFTWKVEQQQ